MSQSFIKIAKRAAQEAGDLIRTAFLDRKFSVSEKATDDYVTSVDKAAEKVIIDIIKKSRPQDIIIGEETSTHNFDFDSFAQTDKVAWIVDPIDGTRNFVEGEPHFAVSIAVLIGKEIVAGVVYNPILDDLWMARKGNGVTYNDTRVRMKKPEKGSGLKGKLLGSGFNYKQRDNIYDQVNILHKFFERGLADFRAKGSASLGLCAAAMGWIHCYYETGVKPWDIAAGCIIVQEAGGHVIDFDLGQRYLHTGQIIAGEVEAVKDTFKIVNSYFHVQNNAVAVVDSLDVEEK